MKHPKPAFPASTSISKNNVTPAPDRTGFPYHAPFRDEHARILESIAVGQPLSEILLAIVSLLEASSPGTIGSIMLREEDGNILRHGASLSLPVAYLRAIDSIAVGPVMGSCGTAAFRKEIVIASDIATDPLWAPHNDIRELALNHGLRACWSMPILSRTGDVLGTFAIYHHTPHTPSEKEQDALKVMSNLASIAIERFRTDEALRISEERLRRAITGASLGIWHFNVVTEERFWSERTLALYGLTETPKEPDAWLRLMHPDDRATVQRAVLEAVKNRVEYSQEYRVVWPDGSIHWIAFRGKGFYDENGNVIHMEGVAFDIDDRKCAEEKLRESEAKFRSFFDACLVGVVVTDLLGVIHECNDAFLKMVGYTCEDMKNGSLDWRTLTPVEYDARDSKAVQELLSRGTITPFEQEFFRKDGSRVPVLLGASWLNRSRGMCAAYFVDLTERKRLEAQYLQSQKMEGMGRLAGGIAHDFNNLLAIILGYAELVEMDLTEESKALANLRHIQTAATRAAKLTTQLLAFSRRQVTEPRVIQPGDLLQGMVEMLTPLIGPSIFLETHFDPDIGWIRIDPHQLEQVIVNLVVNACDAMPDGGTLLLALESVILDQLPVPQLVSFKSGSYVCLSVRDTGIGMTSEVQSRLFEPFFTTKEVGKGTGLGLATCYGIINQSSGYIWVDSIPGVGTKVNVYLPRLEEGELSTAQESERGEKLQGTETVLIVEDEPLVRSLAVTTLKTHGYTILQAENGLEALHLVSLSEAPIHLLLTDAIMPHIGGIELAERMRQIRPEIQVLLASGYAREAFETVHSIPEQMAFLQKPYAAQTLLAKVRHVLDRKGQ